MKQIKITLALLTGLLVWSAFGAQDDELFTLCVRDTTGEPLLYATVTDTSGQELLRTDLNGCLRLKASTDDLAIVLQYPGYKSQKLTLQAGEPQEVVMEVAGVISYDVPTAEREPLRKSTGEHTINGVVQDEHGELLIGASILLVGTSMGTVTDIDGTFELRSSEPCADLQVSYPGFETLEVKAACEGTPQVLTMKDGAVLDEVVVTGLGIKKRDRRSAMSMMDREPTPVPTSLSPPPPPPSSPMMETRAVISPDAYEEVIEAVVADGDAYGGGGAVAVAGELPSAGQLTAGEINDFSKWEMWSDISQEDLGLYRSDWQQYADHRYTLQLTSKQGRAVNNATVELVDGQGNVLWKSRTDAQGRAELWAHYFVETKLAANGLLIRGEADGKRFEVKKAKPFREGINFAEVRVDCREQMMIDMAFVVDATGSMSDEISYLQAELLDVIRRVQEALPEADLQTGSVFYRDENEEYLTKYQQLTAVPKEAVEFLQQQSAQGGGDYPEAVADALETTLDALEWREDASTRLLFLVLDAPPHTDEKSMKRLQVAVTKAAARGIQIVPVSCSGVDKSTEYLLRSMALATNGTYTFVTDHSGIGNGHIEPSTDSYEVEHLNDVLVRLTVSMSKLEVCDTPDVQTPPSEDPVVAAERQWKYYPNPSSGPLTVKFATAEQVDGTFYLADTQGKLLQRFAAVEQQQIDLQQYPAGTYWLRHEAEDGTLTQGQLLLLRR